LLTSSSSRLMAALPLHAALPIFQRRRRLVWWRRLKRQLVAMRTKEFLSKLEHDRIVQAIREAESKTSGEIRVFVQRGKLDVDPLDRKSTRLNSSHGSISYAVCWL